MSQRLWSVLPLTGLPCVEIGGPIMAGPRDTLTKTGKIFQAWRQRRCRDKAQRLQPRLAEAVEGQEVAAVDMRALSIPDLLN